MRRVIPLNFGWRYADSFCEDYLKENADETGFVEVDLPHTNRELPYNYFDESEFQFISCYRKHFDIPLEYKGKRIFVDFEGVMCYAEVYVNGVYAGEHKGGYTPFSIDITDKVRFGENNVLSVKVDSTERPDIPPFGNVVDYLTYGGIYREVSLRVVNPVYIANAFFAPSDVLQTDKEIRAKVFVSNPEQKAGETVVCVALKDGDTVISEQRKTLQLTGDDKVMVEIVLSGIRDVELWDLDNSRLYTCEAYLVDSNISDCAADCAGCDRGVDKGVLDRFSARIGFREARVEPDGFYLNGNKIQLRGLNRHQSYPYVGYAMPERVQRRDADILKYELGLNLVRTSHYPQSVHFLDRCDEIGLLVFEEIPGWQHIGDAEWKKVACQSLREMIERDWNHPSIFLWGVRINESGDDHDFYTETNRIARELDPTRQIGGVRWRERSEFLEDVYTMNDFIHSGGEAVLRDPSRVTGLPEPVPYMVTEFNGHMYPTKRFDQEERLVEHAMRHIRVQNAAAMDPGISGAIGWCAFDYNTHSEFGSGDRICYHGVMDMFRIPKFAAYAYGSQKDPSQGVVLEAATLWARGERSIGGVIPLVIFTNCDYVDLVLNGVVAGRYYPARDEYPGLPHPPVVIKESPEQFGVWGFRWPDGEIVGYINGKPVAKKAYAGQPVATRLEAIADDDVLTLGEIYDATRVVFRVVDQVGNLTPYINESIKLDITGPGRIIGPSEPTLIGGCIGVYVRTTGQSGEIRLTGRSSRFAPAEVAIRVQ